jgi:hypothetical protein
MEIRTLISKFISNIFEKNYAEANKDLQAIVESKVKSKIKKESSKVKGAKYKDSMFGGKKEKNFPKKKLSDKQKDIAKKAPPYDKITGADFKALKKEKNKSSKGNK